MDAPQQPEDTHQRKKEDMPITRHVSFWVVLIIIMLAIAYDVRRCSSSDRAGGRQGQKASVVLATVKAADVPVYISALGNVTPTYNVTVMTQINGILMQEVFFKEGQMVKAGDVLAQIDSRPYLAQLEQYEGDLARDQAQLANAYIDLHRYEILYKTHAVSQQTLATQKALVDQLKGTVRLDQGLIDAAKVSIAYCRITSPVSGRVGLRLVDPGNFVQTSNTTGIAVVNTLDPITVIFTIAEDSIPAVRERIYTGEKFTVEAYDREQIKLLATGELLTIDNQIDPNTGTVKLRALFKNPHYTLFPSQFVNIKLLVNTLKNAIYIPTAAIQYSSTGSYTYVLNPDKKTVTQQAITVGVTTGDISTVTKGLLSGQSVVIQGADNLTDGATITVADHNNKLTAANFSRRLLA